MIVIHESIEPIEYVHVISEDEVYIFDDMNCIKYYTFSLNNSGKYTTRFKTWMPNNKCMCES